MFKDLRNLFVLIFLSVYAIVAISLYVIIASLDNVLGKISEFVGDVHLFYGNTVVKGANYIANLKK